MTIFPLVCSARPEPRSLRGAQGELDLYFGGRGLGYNGRGNARGDGSNFYVVTTALVVAGEDEEVASKQPPSLSPWSRLWRQSRKLATYIALVAALMACINGLRTQ